VFVRDMADSSTTLVSADGGEPADGHSSSASIAATGEVVAFTSRASNWPHSCSPSPDCYAIYLRRLTEPELERVDVNTDGETADGPSLQSALSNDGRYVAFVSRASNLVDDPPWPAPWEAYVRDRETGITQQVSFDDDCKLPPVQSEAGNVWAVTISGSGDLVAFMSWYDFGIEGNSGQVLVRHMTIPCPHSIDPSPTATVPSTPTPTPPPTATPSPLPTTTPAGPATNTPLASVVSTATPTADGSPTVAARPTFVSTVLAESGDPDATATWWAGAGAGLRGPQTGAGAATGQGSGQLIVAAIAFALAVGFGLIMLGGISNRSVGGRR
jgi:hypothetical protein